MSTTVGPQFLFRRGKEYEPIPGVKITDAVQFVGTGNLSVGSDQLFVDKTTKGWRRWVYYKCKKQIPELCTNVYDNKLFIEKIERASLALIEKRVNAAEDLFVQAMEETRSQFSNPRSDSAEALDKLGEICLRARISSKAITCFEYSLHMRKLIYGKEANHEKILQSLVYLGSAWLQHENVHRAIIVFEKALAVAKELSKIKNKYKEKIQVAEILHNLGTCWERLHEHHSAIECYEMAEKIRRFVEIPEACVGEKEAQRCLIYL